MKYKIVSDSSSDILSVEDVPFESVPLKLTSSDREFCDDANLDVSEMIEYLESHKERTGSSCPNVAEWEKAFEDAENIFCLTISGSLSGSYNAALTAAKKYKEEHPERNIHVINTLSTGPETALIIEKLCELIKNDVSFDDIIDQVKAYQRRTHLIFSLESLRNLANNGRVSPIIAKLSGVLGIRIIGKASDEGTLEMMHKTRGERKMLSCIAETIKSLGFNGGKMRIHHCENMQNAELLKQAFLAVFPTSDIIIRATRGLDSFYAERGGLIIGFEGATA